MKAKAYINGVEVKVYAYADGKALCFIPELNTKDWYSMNLIEVRYE